MWLLQEFFPRGQRGSESVDIGGHDHPHVIRGGERVTERGHALNDPLGGGGILEPGDQGGEKLQLGHHAAQVAVTLCTGQNMKGIDLEAALLPGQAWTTCSKLSCH